MVALEKDVARLFTTIPDELCKGAKVEYTRFDQISLSFHLAERQSPENEVRLYDQTRTAIERWVRSRKESGLNVSAYLYFRFGEELASAFLKKEWILSE